jgi:hypothetical protein
MRTRPQIRLAQARLKLAHLERRLIRWSTLARKSALSQQDLEDLDYEVEHQRLEVELAQLDVEE